MIDVLGEGEGRVPGLKCDLCGALLMFRTTLAVDVVLTNDGHARMRETTKYMGWRYMINETHIRPSEVDVCRRCIAATTELARESPWN